MISRCPEKMFQQIRAFHVGRQLAASVNKGDLAKLRKKTGYTFSNCKKALEVNNNDVVQAEKWLKEQAQAMGWAKATKLEGRSTLQGLIGVSVKGDSAALVEINCETDFVARNKVFRALVEQAVKSTLSPVIGMAPSNDISRSLLDAAQVKNLKTADGSTIGDQTALAISSLGENIIFRRALQIKSPGQVFLHGYAHPALEGHESRTGKYGAVLAYRTSKNDSTTVGLVKQLCQHVIGMAPRKVGVQGQDEPVENKEEETVMLHQEFLLDSSVTVGQLVEESGIEIVDFFRFECGESVDKTDDQERCGEIRASQSG